MMEALLSLWTMEQMLKFGLSAFVASMILVVLSTLIPPFEFESAKEYGQFVLAASIVFCLAAIFMFLFAMLVLNMSNYFFGY